MHIPFAYEQDLCDVLAGFLPRLVALERQSFQATYVRRAVGQVIPDLLSISGPRNPVPLRMRGLSNLDAAIVSLLLIGRPLQPRTIADRLYAGLHQVQSRLNKLSSSGVIVTNPTGSFVMAPSIFQDGFHVVAVEAKLSRWREALAQAVTYRAFANRVFVALPEAVVYSKTGLLAEARHAKVGVIAVNPDCAEVTQESGCTAVRSPDWVWLLSRTVGLPRSGDFVTSTC